MNFVIKTARLAFFLTLLYLICRGLMAGIQITHRQVPQTLSLSLLFVTQISYTLIILWLTAVVYHLKAKAVIIGLVAYLVLIIVSFVLSFLLGNGLVASNLLYLQVSSVTAILIIVALLFMIATSFRVEPPVIGVWYRIFFISIIVATLLRTGLSAIISRWMPEIAFEAVAYLSLLPLLPAVALLFTVQKTTLALEGK
ncbi:MAG: hypothetical protein EOP46_03020 [Sphingobacteriaceae bacterium]|nr:MAG: hypothetical protein EOP46_03020 [Sphingobacteriaceae bacterium]